MPRTGLVPPVRPPLALVAVLLALSPLGPLAGPAPLSAAEATAPASALQEADRQNAPERTGQEEASDPEVTLEEGATVEGMTEYHLSNGLDVLLIPSASAGNTTVVMTYFVGSRHEGYGEKGMAHLLEHMLFKGTPDHPNIPQELTERGARPNGTTSADRTNYWETFQPTQDNLEWALDLEADRMVNSFVAEEDLESEMTVVRNEFERAENSPGRVLSQKVQATAYDWHNYGHPTIGTRSDIEDVPIDRLKDFYEKYYQPDNAMLVIAGAFDEERALELVKEKFGPIPEPERTGAMKIYPTYTREPAQDGPRQVTVRRVGEVQRLEVAYHIPAGPHEDHPAVDLLAHVLGNEPSGRLHQALVETGKAVNVSASAGERHDPGLLRLSAELNQEQSLEEARRTILATVDSLETNPPTEEEVERARADRLRQYELIQNNTEFAAIVMSSTAALGDWRMGFIQRDRLEAAEPSDLERVAAEYLVADNRTVGRFVPVDSARRAEIPERPDVAELASSYRSERQVEEGEAFDATPANLDRRLDRDSLASGFEMGLLPKRTRGGQVTAVLQLRHGSEETLRGMPAVGSLAAGMLMRGTEEKSRQEIQDLLGRLRTQMFLGGSETSTFGFLRSNRDSFLESLRLLAEVLREPAFDSTELQQLKQERISQLESQLNQPRPRASRALSRHLNPRPEDHPQRVVPLEEQIENIRAVEVEDVRDFWERFAGSGAGTLAVVGDFDADSVRSIVGDALGDWEADVAFRRIPDPYREVDPERVEIGTPDRENAAYFAGHNIEMRDDHPDYPALELVNFMVGGGFLNSRLAERLRQQEGFSYSVSSSVSVGSLDESGTFRVFAIHAPQNRDRVARAVREELVKVVEDGFTAEELEAAKQGYLRQQQTNRNTDRALVSQVESKLYLDRDFERDAEIERAIRELTLEELNRVAAEYLRPDGLTVVQAGDFSGSGAAEDGGEPSGGGDGASSGEGGER